jgi:hypothetical protein
MFKTLQFLLLSYLFFFFFFLWYWGLNLGTSPWATPPVLFLWWVFGDRVTWTICPGWLQIVILLISPSWVARITGLSHWHPATHFVFKSFLLWFLHSPPFTFSLFQPCGSTPWVLNMLGNLPLARGGTLYFLYLFSEHGWVSDVQ